MIFWKNWTPINDTIYFHQFYLSNVKTKNLFLCDEKYFKINSMILIFHNFEYSSD